MIAVIADDFTGAAEIGGVGLKYGLRVIIETQINGTVDTDLLVIAADTRSLPAESASNEIEHITEQLLKQKPEFIFKKLDSVLRGNIGAEIVSQLKVSGQKRGIIVAGNPAFGRVIENGIYKVNQIPIAETWFARDLGNTAHSSLVTEIVSPKNIQTYSLPVEAELPDQGLIIGDVKDQSDLEKWGKRIPEDTLMAGGAGFFDALIGKNLKVLPKEYQEFMNFGGKSLFVFGSKFPKKNKFPMGLNQHDTVQSNMPDAIYLNPAFDPELLNSWAEEIVKNLVSGKNVIVTIVQNYSQEEKLSARIRLNIGELVRLVVSKTSLSNLVLEGGATTSAIFKSLKVKKLFPNRLIEQGIIQMKTNEFPDMTITTKPGSYMWPENASIPREDDFLNETA